MITFFSVWYAVVVIYIAYTREMSVSIPLSIIAGAILIAQAIVKKNK